MIAISYQPCYINDVLPIAYIIYWISEYNIVIKEEEQMNTGTVKFFNTVKGFGFIKNNETEVETFVHVTALNNDVKELQEGQQVTYNVGQDPKSNRDRAENVTVVDGAAAPAAEVVDFPAEEVAEEVEADEDAE